MDTFLNVSELLKINGLVKPKEESHILETNVETSFHFDRGLKDIQHNQVQDDSKIISLSSGQLRPMYCKTRNLAWVDLYICFFARTTHDEAGASHYMCSALEVVPHDVQRSFIAFVLKPLIH